MIVLIMLYSSSSSTILQNCNMGHIFTNMGRITGPDFEPEWHVPIQARSSFICNQEATIVIEGSSSPVSDF